MDYCNSLFGSLTDFDLRRLQQVQNSLCMVLTHPSKFSYITPQFKNLHWLSVRYRVQFKIGLITYKILSQGQPAYLSELIHPTPLPEIQYVTAPIKFLHIRTFDCRVQKSNKHSLNSFSHNSPVFWNFSPFQIRNSSSVTSFRKHLKTRLFNSSFHTAPFRTSTILMINILVI